MERLRIDLPIFPTPTKGPSIMGKNPPSMCRYLFDDHFCFSPQLGGLLVEPLIHGIQDLLCHLRHLCQALVIEKRLQGKGTAQGPTLLRNTNLALLQLGLRNRKSGMEEGEFIFESVQVTYFLWKKYNKMLTESRWWVYGCS